MFASQPVTCQIPELLLAKTEGGGGGGGGGVGGGEDESATEKATKGKSSGWIKIKA